MINRFDEMTERMIEEVFEKYLFDWVPEAIARIIHNAGHGFYDEDEKIFFYSSPHDKYDDISLCIEVRIPVDDGEPTVQVYGSDFTGRFEDCPEHILAPYVRTISLAGERARRLLREYAEKWDFAI